MAKKDSKPKKDKGEKKDSQGVPQDAIDAIRSAIERTFQVSAGSAQTRTREIVDEIASAAGKIRHTLEEVHVIDELKGLRREVEGLARRVSALELHPKGEAKAEPVAVKDEPTAEAKPAAKPRRTTTAAKGTTATKPAAERASTAKKTTAAKSTTAAKRTTAAKKTTTRRTSAAKAVTPPASTPPAATPTTPTTDA